MVWQSGRHGNPFFSLLYPAGSGDIRGSTCSHHGLQTNMPTLGFGPHYQQASVLFLSFCVSSALSYSTTQISASPFWLVTLCFYFSAWLPGQHGDPLVPWESGKDGEQMVTKAQWGSLKTVSALGALLSQMQRDGCILSQLKGKVDEDTTGFPCRTHTPLSSQIFNFFPACISSHFLWMGAAAAQHWFPQSGGDVQNADRMDPLGAGKSLSCSNCFWRFIWHILSEHITPASGSDKMFGSLNV